MKRILMFCICFLLIFSLLFLFIHSTPERLIRADLFMKGHIFDAFKTQIVMSRIDKQYGKNYSSRNPSIGPEYYDIDQGFWGLWFINHNGTGGG